MNQPSNTTGESSSSTPTLIGVVTVHFTHPDWFRIPWITVLEAALILEFLAYWVVQSIELWDTPDRAERLFRR